MAVSTAGSVNLEFVWKGSTSWANGAVVGAADVASLVHINCSTNENWVEVDLSKKKISEHPSRLNYSCRYPEGNNCEVSSLTVAISNVRSLALQVGITCSKKGKVDLCSDQEESAKGKEFTRWKFVPLTLLNRLEAGGCYQLVVSAEESEPCSFTAIIQRRAVILFLEGEKRPKIESRLQQVKRVVELALWDCPKVEREFDFVPMNALHSLQLAQLTSRYEREYEEHGRLELLRVLEFEKRREGLPNKYDVYSKHQDEVGRRISAFVRVIQEKGAYPKPPASQKVEFLLRSIDRVQRMVLADDPHSP